jgi:hypothetical protein
MVVVVSSIVESAYKWTEAIPEGMDVNPGPIGQFSNIFNNNATLLCFRCNTHVNKVF